MAYRADIEIAVRGAQDLKRLQNQIKSSSDAVDSLNSSLNGVANLLTRSFNNINKVVGEAADNLNKAALGTREASDAARDYYEANKTLNNALRERLKLLGDIQRAERGTVLANIKASQAAREASGFSAFSAGIDIPTQKSIRRNREKRALAEAAAETANQVQKLADRQEEFTLRTDDAAQAAARQTAAFYKQLRVAKEVAKINAAAGPAQLLLAPAAPGAPAMGGGARRRITGAVERLGGARTADEAAATLRLAQATDALAQSSNKIDPQYNRFLPDTAALNATGRGIKQLTTNQEQFNQTVQRGIRFEEKYNQELERRRRLGIGGPATNRMPGATGVTGGPFPVAGPIPLSQFGQGRRVEAGAALRGRAGGALGNALIGGAFPLLFGQGAGAAAGGAIGGLVGGAFGGVGGFAGSLIGTLLGDIASQGQKVKQLAEDIGFSAEQTKILEQSFKQAGQEFEKFESSVQAIRGVGLAINDQASAIQAASQLAEAYGGKIDKITNAFASALSSGKVTQATLNQLTQQGIPIQEKLAAKYGISRSELLAMAKDGEISVQTLADAFVDLANQSAGSAAKIPSAYETASRQIQQSVNDLVTKVTAAFNVQTTNMTRAFDNAVSAIGSAITTLITRFTPLLELVANVASAFINLGAQAASALLSIPGYVNTVVGAVSMMIPGLSATLQLLQTIQAITGGGGQKPRTAADFGRYAPGFMQQAVPQPIPRITVPSQIGPGGGGKGGKGTGAKPPEDRTAQLQADLNAMESMMISQDGIRDALFEGNKELAIRLEYDKKVADITRDTAKALRGANYESERAVIRAQEIVRLKDAELERDDELRELTRDINDIITSTLDDLRGGVNWDDTGLREIFDMRLPDALEEARQNLRDLTDPVNQIIGAATAIGTAFADSFKGIVTGAVSARQGLADFFKSVGNYFVDMAARIAAEALKLQAIQILQSLLKPLLGGAFGVSGLSLPGLEGAGALSTGPLTPGGVFAEGGFVTGPTRALIGEGGEPEYVIPASKMRSAMGRYASGARGASVIPGSSESDPAATGGTATLVPIDVRYTVERINSVDYVTADQFQAGMAQAAEQGARRGEQRALTNIRQNTTTRRRLGL